MWTKKALFLAMMLVSSPLLAQQNAAQDSRPHPSPVVPNGKVFQEILDKLSLTPEQKDKIKALRKTHRESMKTLRAQADKNRLELDQALDKNLESDVLKTAFENFTSARQAVDRQRFQQMLDVRAVLTESQRQLFAQLRPKTSANSGEVMGD